MDKKWINETIRENIDFVPGVDPATVLLSYLKAAELIAQAHEQEMEEAETKWDLHLVGQQKQVEQLLAQVAVMAGAIESVPQFVGGPYADSWCPWCRGVRGEGHKEGCKRVAALESAPTVLWSGEVEVGDEYELNMPDAFWKAVESTVPIGSQVPVIVLAREEE